MKFFCLFRVLQMRPIWSHTWHSQDLLLCKRDAATMETVFNSGSGRLPQLLAQWLFRARVRAGCLGRPEVTAFLSECGRFFPRSVDAATLYPHLAWEYFHQWDQGRARAGKMQHCTLSFKHRKNCKRICIPVLS